MCTFQINTRTHNAHATRTHMYAYAQTCLLGGVLYLIMSTRRQFTS